MPARKSISFFLLICAFVLTGAPKPVRAERDHVTFYLSGDGTLTAAGAGKNNPIAAEGVSFVPGISGRAIKLDPRKGRLVYSGKDVVNQERGAVEFWLRPDWDALENRWETLWEQVGPSENRMRFFKWNRGPAEGTSAAIRFDLGVALPGDSLRTHRPSWHADTGWHHCVITWDVSDTTRMYLDGEQIPKGEAAYGGLMIFEGRNPNASPLVSSNQYCTRWKTVAHEAFAIGCPASPDGGMGILEGAVDEFRIYDHPLDPDTVRGHYEKLAPSIHVFPVCETLRQKEARPLSWRVERKGPAAAQKISYRVTGSAGETIRQGSSTLPAGETTSFIRASVVAPTAGWYWSDLSMQDGQRWRFPVHALPEKDTGPAADRQGRGGATLVDTVDCAAALPADRFTFNETTRIVDSPFGRYRETGTLPWSAMAFKIKRPHPNRPLRLVLTYPNDATRIMGFQIEAEHSSGAASHYGVMTPGLGGPTNRMMTTAITFWGNYNREPVEKLDTEVTLVCLNHLDGSKAALARIEAYEMDYAAPLINGGGQRRVGIYYEDPSIFNSFGQCGTNIGSLWAWTGTMAGYLGFSGENLVTTPVNFYNGPLFHCREGQEAPSSRELQTVLDWPAMIMERFRDEGLFFRPSFTFVATPRLMQKAINQGGMQEVKQGRPTIRLMHSDGQFTNPEAYSYEQRGPCFNFLCPEVRGTILDIFREAAERYARYPSCDGFGVNLWRISPLWFGNRNAGYGDFETALFEKETGMHVDAPEIGPERFAARYRWAVTRGKELWFGWRAGKVTNLIRELAEILHRENPESRLTIVVWYPNSTEPQLLGAALERDLFESGLDLKAVGKLPGVQIERMVFPSEGIAGDSARGVRPEHRWCMDALFDPTTNALFTAPGGSGWSMHYAYMERVFPGDRPFKPWWYTRNPLMCLTLIREPGNSFLDFYAEGLAATDACSLLAGGTVVASNGVEQELREFAAPYSFIPRAPLNALTDLTDPVACRWGEANGQHYLVLVNREPWPIRCRIDFAGGGVLNELGVDKPWRGSAAGAVEYDLKPYGLRVFMSRSGFRVTDGHISRYPESAVQLYRAHLALLQNGLRNAAPGLDEYRLERAEEILRSIGTALTDGRYARARHLMEGVEARQLELAAMARAWEIAGPYPNENGAGLDTAYAPETDPGRPFHIADTGIVWRKHREDAPSLVNLDKLLQPNDWVCAYARTCVYTDRAADCTLSVGSDDGIKIWLNGKLVLTARGPRSIVRGQDKVRVHLNKGPNSLLVKSEEQVGAWEFSVDFLDDAGSPVNGLSYENIQR